MELFHVRRFFRCRKGRLYGIIKWVFIITPAGHYSPGSAIVFHRDAVHHIYFVTEANGTKDSLDLRQINKA